MAMTDHIVLFPFDNVSVPFRNGLEVSLVQATKYENNPVLLPGPPGTPDAARVAYYGTVIRIGDEFRMWYLGGGSEREGAGEQPLHTLHVCYATSQDGIHWVKPKLGLVPYNGSTDNNLVDLGGYGGRVLECVVLYEPDDPDPARRFKMTYEAMPGARMCVAWSSDGLRWTNSPRNPVTRIPLEQSGLVRWQGCYYVTGQNVATPARGGYKARILTVHASYDFEHWTEASVIGFRRDNLGPLRPAVAGKHTGEQVHLGASLWPRGNVLLGVYGQWHGPGPEMDDRRLLGMDLGLVVSNDAMHYREPIPDFKFVSGAEDTYPAYLPPLPALSQGQGFENVGDQTYFWYSLWGPGGGTGIRLATWERDRFGYFSVRHDITEGQGPFMQEELPYGGGVMPHFISAPIRPQPGSRVFVNAAGLSQHSQIAVELLDEQFRPLPGFSGDDCLPVHESGLRQPVWWRNRDRLDSFDRPIRVQVTYGGLRIEDAKVYALYVGRE